MYLLDIHHAFCHGHKSVQQQKLLWHHQLSLTFDELSSPLSLQGWVHRLGKHAGCVKTCSSVYHLPFP